MTDSSPNPRHVASRRQHHVPREGDVWVRTDDGTELRVTGINPETRNVKWKPAGGGFVRKTRISEFLRHHRLKDQDR